MRDRESTPRARELGRLLRRMRKRAEIQAIDLAATLGWSPTKVSRMETGSYKDVNEIDIVRYAAYVGADRYQVNHLLKLCKEAEVPGYWVTDRLAALIFHESTASASLHYDPLVVPGLLQTEGYAAELMGRERLRPGVLRGRLDARMERQSVVHRRPFTFYIHEQALRLPVGGDRVMNEQLLKLVLMADLAWLNIRIVPTELGENAVFGGGFALFHFKDAPPLIFVEHDVLGLFLEEEGYVARYHAKLAELNAAALDGGESRRMLARLASEFDQPEDLRDAEDRLAKEQLQRKL